MERLRPEELENKLGYRFRNEELLLTALTHTSFAHENKVKSYERLEFLGDAVIDLLLSTILYQEFINLNEGTMAQIKAAVASEDILYEIGRDIGLENYIFLGKGELKSGGKYKKSIIADVVEALVAAIYVDCKKDLNVLENVFHDTFKRYIEIFFSGKRIFDYKTKLQEITQDRFKQLPVYDTVSQKNKFITTLYIDGKIYSKAEGFSKKESEKLAAKIAYEKLKEEEFHE
ncbi:ribonuclease III [Thermosipho africanus]|nr:ribonuclease III [Thermosipho africanus]